MEFSSVRSNFPSLKGDYIYLDNAGGTQILASVVNRTVEYYHTMNVQLGGLYSKSIEAKDTLAKASDFMASFMNAKSSKEVIIGTSTTMLIRLISICIGKTLKKGDQIIISQADHEANRSPWLALQEQGIDVVVWSFNQNSKSLEPSDLIDLITKKTKWVCCCHVSNIFGTIHPIETFTQIAHQNNCQIFIDGVAYAPHRAIDVQAWNVDMYVCSLYKIFAGHTAVLYGKEELLKSLPGINHNFISEEETTYKFQPGGPNYELTAGLIGLQDYFLQLGDGDSVRSSIVKSFDRIKEHETTITKFVLGFLDQQKNIEVIGHPTHDPNKRVSTISFIHKKLASSFVVKALADEQIGIKHGDFYAKEIIKDLNIDQTEGVIRISIVHYNTIDELRKVIHHLDRIFNT